MMINHQHPQWWENCDAKVSRNAVANMYAHVSFENKAFSSQYIASLLNYYQKAEFDRVRYFERPMIRVLQLQDSYQADRVKQGITGLFEMMKISMNYYKYTDSLIEF